MHAKNGRFMAQEDSPVVVCGVVCGGGGGWDGAWGGVSDKLFCVGVVCDAQRGFVCDLHGATSVSL